MVEVNNQFQSENQQQIKQKVNEALIQIIRLKSK